MTKERFDEQVVALIGVLHSVSYSLLQNPHDQADAVQECIKKALMKRESLRDDASLKTWLIKILIHECHNIYRQKRRVIPSETIEIMVPPSANEELFHCVGELPEKFRLPLVLHCVSGYKTKEISAILRIHESTVKYRLTRARKLLTMMLEEGGNVDEAY